MCNKRKTKREFLVLYISILLSSLISLIAMSYVFYYGNKDLINIDNPTTISAAFVYIDLAKG